VSTPSGERRASLRDSVELVVRVKAGEVNLAGRLTSLSRMGALVVVDTQLAVGTPIALELELPEGRGPLTLRGQVVRDQPSGSAHALGVLFAPLAPITLALIETLLSL
jgi:hypothetical protein